MIIECPSCRTRYLVQIGLFAQGGRQVRCARCKYEWHAGLPAHIDVFKPLSEFVPILPPPPSVPLQPLAPTPTSVSKPPIPPPIPPLSPSPASPSPIATEVETSKLESSNAPTANLPAVIKKWQIWAQIRARIDKKKAARYLGIAILVLSLLLWPILDRRSMVRVFPAMRDFYELIGFEVPGDWSGLMFDQVTSEIRYDGGTMKLVVDGVIHNTASQTQQIPDIKARAIGADRRVIQSWWVEAPAATIEAGADIPFHTEVNSPMEHTIENVYLEFYNRGVKKDAGQ